MKDNIMSSNSHQKVIAALAKQVAIDRQRYGQEEVPFRLFQQMFSRPLNEIESDPKNSALKKIQSIVGKKKRNQTYNELYSFVKGQSSEEELWNTLQKELSYKIQHIDFIKENVDLFGYKLAAVATGVSLAAIGIDLLVSAASYVFDWLATTLLSGALHPTAFTLIAPTLPYLILGIAIAAVVVVGTVLLVSAVEFAVYKRHEKKEELVEEFSNVLDLGL